MNDNNTRKFKPTKYLITLAVILLLTLLLNLLAVSEDFCDLYTTYFFPLILNTYGRFSDIFPFSFGQVLIAVGILLVLGAILLLPLSIFLRSDKFKSFRKIYYKTFLMILACVALVMTLNCSIPYGCSRLSIRETETDYTIGELRTLRNFLVEKCNEYSQLFPHDENGYIITDVSMKEINEISRQALLKLSEEYPRLAGYYPDMKPIFCSDLMVQTNMAGIYFPFSMEANYNSRMYVMEYYNVFCHERAHIKGYMFEEEANFLSYLACIGSDDLLCQYSGYLSVLYYVNNDYRHSTTDEDYSNQIKILPEVRRDCTFVTEETRQNAQRNTGISEEKATEMNQAFMDSYLEYYDIEGGRASYARVTGLLLEYYEQNGY